ncbi:hypothetical protein EI555_007338 [Monodon monoceros]|uniref:Uncharacterized protein n=1 Tax=Monodon monoceros TaxID=40151 RepID=A0A4U1ELD3_MONMO|nr:hypothetical protein EI555_007338 [Monodon monoceros]
MGSAASAGPQRDGSQFAVTPLKGDAYRQSPRSAAARNGPNGASGRSCGEVRSACSCCSDAAVEDPGWVLSLLPCALPAAQKPSAYSCSSRQLKSQKHIPRCLRVKR